MLAVIRGRAPRRAPTLPSVQLAVAKLVAAATLIGSAFTASRSDLPVRPAMAVSASVSFQQVAVDPPPAAPRPPVETAGPTYEVRRHDSLWVIAERTLGDGFRWREIRDLNVGRTMPDGDVISGATEDIRPGWLLVLPVGSTVESRPADGTTEQAAEVVIVERGDHLWSIAEDEVAERLGREPTDGEVSDLWRRTIETNRDRLADPSNPSLIFAGQEILVPGDGAVDPPGSEAPPPEQRPTEPLPPEVPTRGRAGSPDDDVNRADDDVVSGGKSRTRWTGRRPRMSPATRPPYRQGCSVSPARRSPPASEPLSFADAADACSTFLRVPRRPRPRRSSTTSAPSSCSPPTRTWSTASSRA